MAERRGQSAVALRVWHEAVRLGDIRAVFVGEPEDIIPGVLLHYDIPDLVRSLGARVTEKEPLQGADDLSQSSTPLTTLEH